MKIFCQLRCQNVCAVRVVHIFILLQVQALKDKGNECVRNKKYAESVLHYTHAIKLDPMDYSLYSNRSLAFLKMQHFYFAMEDAKEAIRLKPNWAKVIIFISGWQV